MTQRVPTLGSTAHTSIMRAYEAGLIVVQRSGAAPDPSAGVQGAIAIDGVSGTAFVKTADGWVQSPGTFRL